MRLECTVIRRWELWMVNLIIGEQQVYQQGACVRRGMGLALCCLELPGGYPAFEKARDVPKRRETVALMRLRHDIRMPPERSSTNGSLAPLRILIFSCDCDSVLDGTKYDHRWNKFRRCIALDAS